MSCSYGFTTSLILIHPTKINESQLILSEINEFIYYSLKSMSPIKNFTFCEHTQVLIELYTLIAESIKVKSSAKLEINTSYKTIGPGKYENI